MEIRVSGNLVRWGLGVFVGSQVAYSLTKTIKWLGKTASKQVATRAFKVKQNFSSEVQLEEHREHKIPPT